jgi:hypothetical protein
MGRDCASERVPIALAEGRPEDAERHRQHDVVSHAGAAQLRENGEILAARRRS